MALPQAKDGMIYAIYLDAESAHQYFRSINGPGPYADVDIEANKPDANGNVIVECAAWEPEKIMESVLDYMHGHGLPNPRVATIFEMPQVMQQKAMARRQLAFDKANEAFDCDW
jgi:hypothetical protein